MSDKPRVYLPGERPDVEVLVDQNWCPGELRMWRQQPDGTWVGNVGYRTPGETSSRLDSFPADHIRLDWTVDKRSPVPGGPEDA